MTKKPKAAGPSIHEQQQAALPEWMREDGARMRQSFDELQSEMTRRSLARLLVITADDLAAVERGELTEAELHRILDERIVKGGEDEEGVSVSGQRAGGAVCADDRGVTPGRRQQKRGRRGL